MYYFIGLILILTIIISILSNFNLTVIKNIFKTNTSENITTLLKEDSDFYNWYMQFDKLYKKKKGKNYPELSLNNEMFNNISKLLNNEKTNIYYNNGKYFISDIETLELDINTRSIRYIKYKNNIPIEITEIRLKNGLYYLQIIDKNYLHKITLNKDNITKKRYVNDDDIIIKNSIFQTENFKW